MEPGQVRPATADICLQKKKWKRNSWRVRVRVNGEFVECDGELIGSVCRSSTKTSPGHVKALDWRSGLIQTFLNAALTDNAPRVELWLDRE